MTDKRIVVYGGANLDIAAVSKAPILPEDSNPSQIFFAPGGVGRNIAENLARLSVPTSLVTAVGSDDFSDHLLAQCTQAGIDCSYAYRSTTGKGCYYLSIHNPEGEMALAASDMEAIEDMPLEHAAAAMDHFAGADIVVLDANLTEARIAQIVEGSNCPLLADPVSATKASRLRPFLGKLHTLKANFMELSAMVGEELHDLEDVARVCIQLMEENLQHIFVTMGSGGAYYCARDGSGLVESPPLEVRNVTGAGDSFVAGLAYALLQGEDTRSMALTGTAMARITLQSPYSVNRQVNEETLAAEKALLDTPPEANPS